MIEDDYVELEAVTRWSGSVTAFVALLLVAYLTFIGIVVWQIGDNTHELLEQSEQSEQT